MDVVDMVWLSRDKRCHIRGNYVTELRGFQERCLLNPCPSHPFPLLTDPCPRYRISTASTQSLTTRVPSARPCTHSPLLLGPPPLALVVFAALSFFATSPLCDLLNYRCALLAPFPQTPAFWSHHPPASIFHLKTRKLAAKDGRPRALATETFRSLD
ncbi:hypothetical protein B0T13DRAFT_311551 [Neurospora crassa]|nr:hypothetical protein B0T13DRAFT_311551 [Neurospora crassa]